MSQISIDSNRRMSLRISEEDKKLLLKAATISGLDLTKFVIAATVKRANEVIAEQEQLRLSSRDTLHIMALLESPPEPNSKLIRAAKSLAEQNHE